MLMWYTELDEETVQTWGKLRRRTKNKQIPTKHNPNSQGLGATKTAIIHSTITYVYVTIILYVGYFCSYKLSLQCD